MKGLQVVISLSFLLIAAGCAQDGLFRRALRSDPAQASEPSALASSTEEKHTPSVSTTNEHTAPASAESWRQPGKPSVTSAQAVTNIVPDASQPNSPHQILTVAFQGQDKLPQPRKLENAKPITLTLDDVELRKAFELLAKEGSMNMLVSPAVTGKITISLKDISLDVAFEALLKASNLVAQREKGIVYVYTQEELARIGDEKLPIRMYRLNYIKSVDLEKMIKPFLSAKGKLTSSPPSSVGIQSTTQGSTGIPPAGDSGGGAAPGGGGAGAGGSASGGDSLASGEVVIIRDREEVLKTIEPLIAQIDVQPPQVLIEAVILLVRLDKGKEFGINFAVVNNAGKILSVVGNGALLNTALGFVPATAVDAAGLVKGNAGSGFAADKYGLSFGATSKNVQGFLRAVETLGKTEILAAPRMLVLNKQLAELQLGDRLGYTTISQSVVSTTQQVQFLNVGTQLRVRPFISSDGMVRMEIHPERSSGSVVNNVPQTNTAEVTTNVMVPDGATIVIGGLIENIREKHQNGIPFLSNLPGVGVLFRERTFSETKTELIVLLTPRIWSPHAMQDACPRPSEPVLPPPTQLPPAPMPLPTNR